MITEPEYLGNLEKLEKWKKNKALSVAAKSRKRGNIQNKSTERKKKKEEVTTFRIYHLQKNVKQIYLVKGVRKMLVVAMMMF